MSVELVSVLGLDSVNPFSVPLWSVVLERVFSERALRIDDRWAKE